MPTERCCLEAACSRPGYFASITGMDCYPEVQRLPPKAYLTLSLLHASSKWRPVHMFTGAGAS